MTLENIFGPNVGPFVPLIYIIPTFTLYIFVSVVIFIFRKRSDEFNIFIKLCYCLCTAAMCREVTLFMYLRIRTAPSAMPLWNFYNAHPWILNCVMMAKGMAFYSYQLFDCLLAFNRLTAVCMVTRYGMFWNDHFNKFILFVIGGAVVLCWNTPFVTFLLVPSEELNVKMIIDGIAEVLLQDKGVSYITFPIVIVAMLFNLTTLACIWKRRGKTAKTKLLNDLKLLLLSLVSTTAQLVVSLLFLDEVQKYITIDYTSRFVILDVILCLQPWLFLALEKNVQKKLGELFCCAGNSKVQVYNNNDGCLHPPSRGSARRIATNV